MRGLPFFESRFDRHFKPCWESGQTLSELLECLKLGPLEEGELPAEEWGFKGPHCRVQALPSCSEVSLANASNDRRVPHFSPF
jgi:hypothetical protein